MDRAVLRNYVVNHSLGTLNKGHRQIVITLNNIGNALCSKQNLTNHLEDWNTWPALP